MRKFKDFSVIQILREIIFGHNVEVLLLKGLFMPFSRGFNICQFFGKFQPSQSAKIHKNQNSEPLICFRVKAECRAQGGCFIVTISKKVELETLARLFTQFTLLR